MNDIFADGFEVYLDESGNTGLHFLDPKQPVFVVAGWMVPRAQLAEAEREVALPVGKLRGLQEIKGSQLLTRPYGQEVAAELLHRLMQLGCAPVFSLFEKLYAVAGKIIETFLDPPYNNHVSNSFILDVKQKQAIANRLYGLPPGSLDATWDSIRHPESISMTAALSALILRLDLLASTDLADLLRGALSHIDEIAEVLIDVQQDPVWKHGEGLALPMVIDLVGDIDRLASLMRIRGVNIVHDETRQFSRLLADAFERNRNATPLDYHVSTGRVFRIGYSSVQTLTFARSHEEPMIQAADVLAATLRAYAGTDTVGRPLSDRLWQWCSMLLLEASMSGRGAAHWAGSDNFLGHLGKRMMEGAEAWSASVSQANSDDGAGSTRA